RRAGGTTKGQRMPGHCRVAGGVDGATPISPLCGGASNINILAGAKRRPRVRFCKRGDTRALHTTADPRPFIPALAAHATIPPPRRKEGNMDGRAAIEWNRLALKRIVAALIAVARLDVDHEAPAEGPTRPTLPRHLWLAILRLLRPAEAAARRLIIAAARGITVTLPPPRKRKTKPVPAEQVLRRFGIAVTMPAAKIARAATAGKAATAARPRSYCLPLLDP